MVDVTGKDGVTYSFGLDLKLKKFLDEKIINRINKKDKDYVMIITGYEGSGKSTFASQIGKYVDPNLNIDRICFNAEQFKEAIVNAKKGECVVFDEAVSGFSSGGSTSKVGKLLKSLMMQMRQKNLFVIVVIPSVFELNRYAVLHRAISLFYVYTKAGYGKKQDRYYWVGYNKRDTKRLYLTGKKTQSIKVRSRFNGSFYGKWGWELDSYIEKKSKSLEEEGEDTPVHNKYRIQRDFVLKLLSEHVKSVTEISRRMKSCQYAISQPQLSRIVNGIGI